MKRILTTIILGVALAAPALAGDAGMAKLGDIMIHDGWARASIGNAPNSAAYMTLMTHGTGVDKLIAVSTPVAEKAELHSHIIDDGIARMRPVDGIEVAPGETATLEPGGLHVMLMGLKGSLDEGTDLTLTLTFEKAGDVTLELPIRGLKGEMKHGSGHNHGS